MSRQTRPVVKESSPQHFVIQSLPRSGGIMLGRMLDRHPELRCFGEIFSTKPVHLGPNGFAGAPLNTAARLDYFAEQRYCIATAPMVPPRATP